MTSDLSSITVTYYKLSSLYKNPTRFLKGKAAANLDVQHATGHERLLAEFDECKTEWSSLAQKPAIYFKVLALLYEIDDYRGVQSSVRDLILEEWESIRRDMQVQIGNGKKSDKATPRPTVDFADPDIRSLWKAKVLCGVAAVEIRRKGSRLDAMLDELNALEVFVEDKLHKFDAGLPSWTMLAFVRAAQARVARQHQAYDYVQERLLNVLECLDERAAEIIAKLTALEQVGKKIKEQEDEIQALTDDLTFIKQKQTLSSLFNVGLANLQRGFLDSADYACRAARLQFRLHGQFLHRMYNELAILSIKRARLSAEDKDELRMLKSELEQNILPLLKPMGGAGNPKLYLYGLRETAVLQFSCGETNEMLDTLEKMEKVEPLSSQWNSRINILRARYCYLHWKHYAEGSGDDSLLREALTYSEAAFEDATGLSDGIEGLRDTKKLLASIKGSTNKSLLDTVESLVTYGTVQLFLGNPPEAIKSANAAVELSILDNPRLLAMSYLVLAEAYVQKGLYVEAQRHLVSAKTLENQIDHKYVEDRRRAVEDLMPQYLDLSGSENIDQAADLLLYWFIDRRSSKANVNKVADDIGKDRKTVKSYLEKLRISDNRYSQFRHLLKLLNKKQRGRKPRP